MWLSVLKEGLRAPNLSLMHPTLCHHWRRLHYWRTILSGEMIDPPCQIRSSVLMIQSHYRFVWVVAVNKKRASIFSACNANSEGGRENCKVCCYQHANELGQLAYSRYLVPEQIATLGPDVPHLANWCPFSLKPKNSILWVTTGNDFSAFTMKPNLSRRDFILK